MADNDTPQETDSEASAPVVVQEPASGTWDGIVHNSVIFLMAQLLGSEFKAEFIFAASPDWKNDSWNDPGEESEEDIHTPDIVVGDPQSGKVGLHVEVETKRTIDGGGCSAVWKKSSEGPLIVVTPARRLKETLRDSVKNGIQIEEVWIYELRDWSIRLRRDSVMGESPVLKNAEIEGEIIFNREEEIDSAGAIVSDSHSVAPSS